MLKKLATKITTIATEMAKEEEELLEGLAIMVAAVLLALFLVFVLNHQQCAVGHRQQFSSYQSGGVWAL